MNRAVRHGLALVLALLALAPGWAFAASAPLVLGGGAGSHDGWTAAQVWFDSGRDATVAQVLSGRADFQPAGAMGANLGKRQDAVWIRLPLRVAASAGPRWVLDIDYPSLDRIDVYLVAQDRVVRHAVMGDHLAFDARPLATRSHALMLDLPPGTEWQLLLRVQTTGSLLVPLMVLTPEAFALAESHEQALQGLLAGAALCLLMYSLAQWVSLKDPMFGLYAVTLLGTAAFFAALSGVGPQYLWGGSEWLTQNAPPFTILVGVCGAFFFVLKALEVARLSPRVAWVIRVGGAVAGATAGLFLLGVIDYQTAQSVGMSLGPLPLVLVLPTAFKRMRGGDRAAVYLLVGWGCYSIGVLVIVGLLKGWMPVGFWTLHAFQFASLVEMGMWMLLLGQRVQDIRLGAVQVQRDRDRMHQLAHTDALTGLLNRRGLAAGLPPLLAACGPRQPLALYLIDLDGFKPVNDSLGHDAGDELLVGVAQRLKSELRSADLVCRLGGDEFVLAVGGLNDDADADRVGRKLLAAFERPFEVVGRDCRVGLTIGYALAPQDDLSLDGLLRRADAAMYAGKQMGKNQVRRGASRLVAEPAS